MPLVPALLLLQYSDDLAPASGSPVAGLVLLCVLLLVIASMWIVYSKAGEYGWACLIPIWSGMVMARIAGKPLWWGLLLLIPLVGIIVWFVLAFGLAERFGKSGLFGLGIALLPFIFFPVLAFGDSEATPQFA